MRRALDGLGGAIVEAFAMVDVMDDQHVSTLGSVVPVKTPSPLGRAGTMAFEWMAFEWMAFE